MKVVLFCGGLGMRLRDYAENVPKPMVPLGYRPILWHLMKYYAHYGHRDFVLCLGYRGDHDQELLPQLRGRDLERLHPLRGRPQARAPDQRHRGLADHVRRDRVEQQHRPASDAR